MRAKLLLIVATAGVALTTGAVVGGAASTAPPSGTLAHQLVSRLVTARTPGARYQAVLAMMKALRAPVFTPAGRRVLAGGGGFQVGFNLYDFQLHAVAESLGNEMSLTDLAAALSAGRRVDPGRLDAALVSGVAAAAARPSSSSSLLPLLVRQLGLQRKPALDLAAKPSAKAVALDPLQVLLLAVDAAGHKPAVPPRVLSTEAKTGDVTCYTPGGSPAAGPSLVGQGWLGLDAVATDAASMQLLVGPSPAPKTHYGPAGHPGGGGLAGTSIRLGVHVLITQPFPDKFQCGSFRSVTESNTGRPAQRFSGVAIDWRADGNLPKYLNVVRKDGATDAKGEAHLALSPNDEKLPGFGEVVTRSGNVSATAFLPPALQGTFLPQKPSDLRVTVQQPWTVELHKPRGFKFQTTLTFTKTVPGVGAVTDTSELDGHICGDDPFATAGWTLTATDIETNPITGVKATPPTTVTGVVWPSGGTLDDPPTALQLLIGDGPPFQVRRTTTIQFYDQPTMTGTFPLVEDTSCPASG